MARTGADVRALVEIMAGPDAGDALSAPVPIREIGRNELHGLRIGLLESDALGSATSETFHAVQRTAKLLSENHFVVEPFPLAGLDQALELWWFFFGNVINHLVRGEIAGRESAISPMLREYLSVSTPTAPITFEQFLKACTDRDLLRAQILRQLADVPILLSPVCANTAFRHGEGNWQPGTGYRDNMRHSQWLNLLGFAGISVPMGTSADGLPIGVQLVGRSHEEELLLAVAESLEQSRGPWQPPPISVI
jgi:Asp-tRNA(Asn)/Glu-tRNA(Gln) amidotransferase A subunit family amidase